MKYRIKVFDRKMIFTKGRIKDMFDRKKYLIMSLIVSIAIVMCIVAFAMMPFKELPFIYNEF